MAKRRGRNEGSIVEQPNGKFRAFFRTPNGKRLTKVFSTQAECKKWFRQNENELENGVQIDGQVLLSDYLRDWVSKKVASLRPKTAWSYEHYVQDFIIPHLGKVNLRDLTMEKIENFYHQLKADGKGFRTIQYVHRVLFSALKKAMVLHLIPFNPADGAEIPKPDAKVKKVDDLDEDQNLDHEKKFLTTAQVSAFLIAASANQLYALFHLAVIYGIRLSELLGLRWSDITWGPDYVIITVRHQLQTAPRMGLFLTDTKTPQSKRSIRGSSVTLEVLRQHQAAQEIQKKFAASRWNGKGFLFTTTTGSPKHHRVVQREFKEILLAAGLSDIRFHDLRHTAASIMLNYGVPIIVVSRILGHSRPSITTDLYGHLIPAVQNDATQMIDQLIAPIRVNLTQNGNMGLSYLYEDGKDGQNTISDMENIQEQE